MPQIGGRHWLYLAFDANNPLNRVNITSQVDENGAATQTLGTPVTVNDITASMQLWDILRDVQVGGSPTFVDSTVREDIKAGFSTELLAFSTGSMTLQSRYEPTDDGGVDVDIPFVAMMGAFAQGGTMFAIDLDKRLGLPGARGLGGNWSIGFSNPKPVQGLVVVDWEMRISGKPQYLQANTAGSQFRAIAPPV